MQFPTRFEDLPEYAFPRLRALLSGTQPGGPEIPMSIGEPQHAIPDFVPEVLARHSATLNRYPPNEGIPELRQAISDWLAKRSPLRSKAEMSPAAKAEVASAEAARVRARVFMMSSFSSLLGFGGRRRLLRP